MSRALAVFASGSGSNLQAILDHFRHSPRAHVALVVSDRAGAGALRRGSAAGVATAVVATRGRSEVEVASDLLTALETAAVEVIALAGYLRLVPASVVARYRGRIVNIHPSLLPAFGGPGMYGERVHRAVLDSGCTVSGATVHQVDEAYDRGRVLAQWPVPVYPGDDAGALAARVLTVEHALYPAVLDWLIDMLEADAGAAHLGPPSAPTASAAASAGSAFVLSAAGGPDAAAIRALIRTELS